MSRTTRPDGLRTRLDELLEEYRATLHDSLEGLTEQEARASLVPSKRALLGLLKHVTLSRRSGSASGQRPPRRELGVASNPDRSFVLRKVDTIASVQMAHRETCEASRRATAELALDDEVTGTGIRALWQLYLQLLRELAQHAGHADILREQVLAARQA